MHETQANDTYDYWFLLGGITFSILKDHATLVQPFSAGILSLTHCLATRMMIIDDITAQWNKSKIGNRKIVDTGH